MSVEKVSRRFRQGFRHYLVKKGFRWKFTGFTGYTGLITFTGFFRQSLQAKFTGKVHRVYRVQGGSSGFCVFQRFSCGFKGFLRVSGGFCGFQVVSGGFRRFQWF